MNILVIDNYDSFTFNLVHLIHECGHEATVWRNDKFKLEDVARFDKILLSPGPGIPSEAGVMPNLIKEFIEQKPILGICLGHQALGEFFGATVVKALKPMHGKISEITCVKDPFFKGLPEKMPVVRYHSLIVKNTGDQIIPLAYTTENELMAFRHKSLPVYALQFHPEAILTTFGLEMLRNWVSIVNIAAR